jgi:gamma-glutamyltranspeptidase
MQDFRETAPAAASEDMYNDNIYESLRGGLASGVPGDLRGLEYLHKKYGVRVVSLLFLNSIDRFLDTPMASRL